ncbi:MAG: sulfite exporter TauE/SafE family protein [Anaerolineales bacterium]|jgi:uncharacterized membrane protein YfcA
MHPILIVAIIFLAVFTQSLTGFGSALVSMALLPLILDIRTATPLVALVGGTLEILLLLRYRRALNLRAVWRMTAASALGVPLGVLALRQVDERLMLTLLGLVISLYAIYALLNLRTPELRHPAWAYGLGFLGGAFGGAYNTSGPPVIIYGNARRWLPAEFKSNLQGFFLFNSILVIAGHLLSHNITPLVYQDYLMALPAILVGVLAGISLDRIVDPDTFRRIVLWFLVALGIRLII